MKKLMLLLLLTVLGGAAAVNQTGGSDGNMANLTDTNGITRVHFTYDQYAGDQFRLDAWVEDFGAGGAVATVEKRVGPMNHTGVKKEGKVTLSRAQADELLEILSRYDIRAWSRLRRRGYGTSPSRIVAIFYGDEMVDIPWDAIYPESLPPQEDILYCELYNFFNGVLRETPGWEAVRSDDLEDPRDNPAYRARTVDWFGGAVPLVPGTGSLSESWYGAELDYGTRRWWDAEGFTGVWELATEGCEENTEQSARLCVEPDGSVTLTLDGTEWTGRLPEKRYYREEIGLRLESDGERRRFGVRNTCRDSYEQIRISAHPGPHPEPQFPYTDDILDKTE